MSVIPWYDASSLGNMSSMFRNKGLVFCSRLEISCTVDDEATELYRNVGGTIYLVSGHHFPEEGVLNPYSCENLTVIVGR